MVNDWKNLKQTATTSANKKGRTVTNSYGRSVNTSDLLPTGEGYDTTTGIGDAKLSAINRASGVGQQVVPTTYNGETTLPFDNANVGSGYSFSNNGQGFVENNIGNVGGGNAQNISIPFDMNNPDAGGLYKSGNKYMIRYQGKDMELSENEYINYISQIEGF